ncbi:serine/threonine-protein kinase [Streptomyces nitrosporeus]
MQPLSPDDPSHLGPYWLLGRIGAGGMGRVYLGRHRDGPAGELAAVKTIRAEIAESSAFRARFAREVRAARRVSDEWTAPVLDADTEAALPWIATAYVAGPTLQQVVDSDFGPLPSASAHVLANRMAQALRAMHASGIVHRDLKPSNVLLTPEGPKVIDFGIARALEGTDAGTLSSTGSAAGSPRFMSPEQVRGQRVTPAADVFSLGCVLAYAATGQTPFGDAEAGVHALLFRIAYEEPDLTGVPESVADLVRECLAKDPAERPSTERITEWTRTAPAGGWLPPALLARVSGIASAPAPQSAFRAPEEGGQPLAVLSTRTSEPSAGWEPERVSPGTDTLPEGAGSPSLYPAGRRWRGARRAALAASTTLVVLAAMYAWWRTEDSGQSPPPDYSGAWLALTTKDESLLALRLDVPEDVGDSAEVSIVSATEDLVCRGSGTAEQWEDGTLVVGDFSLQSVTRWAGVDCDVPEHLYFTRDFDTRITWAEGRTTFETVEKLGPSSVEVPARLQGVWRDGKGLRLTLGPGGVGSVVVQGELTTGSDRPCRWEAVLLSYEDGLLRTTGAQPRVGEPRCAEAGNLYDYWLASRKEPTLRRGVEPYDDTTTFLRGR